MINAVEFLSNCLVERHLLRFDFLKSVVKAGFVIKIIYEVIITLYSIVGEYINKIISKYVHSVGARRIRANGVVAGKAAISTTAFIRGALMLLEGTLVREEAVALAANPFALFAVLVDLVTQLVMPSRKPFLARRK